MNYYSLEFKNLKPSDSIQYIDTIVFNFRNYDFIATASHGYMVIPSDDKYYNIAEKCSKYSYRGKLAIYLEEDCDMTYFMRKVSELEVTNG
jgi:hypothetical protein